MAQVPLLTLDLTAVVTCVISRQNISSSWTAFIALVPTWLATSWLILKAKWFWTHRPDLQFGWVVVVLCAYLLWEAWEERPSPVYRWNAAGLSAAVAGLALLFVVQIYQAAFGTNAASLAALACGVMLVIGSNLHYVFGWSGVRRFGFGFAFLLVALPMPSVIHNPLVSGLQAKVAAANVETLNLFGVPAHRVGSLIKLPNCTLGVDEACSGIRSLQSTVMATLFIGYLTLRRMGLRVLLVSAGIVLAILGNVVRSIALSLAANRNGPSALDSFHDSAGWSILIFTVTGVALISWWFGRFERRLNQSQSKSKPGHLEGAG